MKRILTSIAIILSIAGVGWALSGVTMPANGITEPTSDHKTHVYICDPNQPESEGCIQAHANSDHHDTGEQEQ